jgi:hypothetical protein
MSDIPGCLNRPRHKFVGLKNPSATCYMNAVFQQLFMQPSIRHLVLSAPESPVLDHNLDNVFHELQVRIVLQILIHLSTSLCIILKNWTACFFQSSL